MAIAIFYRPGDSIHMTRMFLPNDWKVMKEFPRSESAYAFREKEFQSFLENLDAQGSFETTVLCSYN
jgi:hypothetical protein